MSKLFITGITGQVGSLLADYVLKNTEIEVIGLMRWQESLSNINHLCDRINRGDRIQLEYGDLNDITSLQRILAKHKPVYISHLAAQSFPKTSFDSPIETLQTNIIGTANLLEAIRGLKSNNYNPSVHICSSSEVYGKAKSKEVLNEDTQFHGASPYSISKIGTDFLGQFYAEAYGIKTFVTRMGTHSGPRRSDVFFESTVAKQIALIENGLQDNIIYIGNLASVRTYQDARDAVRAYFMLLERMSAGDITVGECFNIAGDEAFHLEEILNLLISFSKVKNIAVEIDQSRLRPLDADYQLFDNKKIKETINWVPEISVSDMLKDLLDHWRSEIKKGNIPLSR
ncbi:GDP-mannose 4,6-dehydratase [Gammaproteobacteria bacterium]|nr:GDP-mannose 4,6-dehydratase [Gammaproteobacteria bacterium]